MVRQAEQSYGQINPAYESSRPNSLYSSSVNGAGHHAGQPARPSSALTSYSNFHGQRKGGGLGNSDLPGHVNLTQEALSQPQSLPPALNHNTEGGGGGAVFGASSAMNDSFDDDLPPPPPPLNHGHTNVLSDHLPEPQV